jgi:hypothetical protein
VYKLYIFIFSSFLIAMATVVESEFIDYYSHFCELTIWFKKIILHNNPRQAITIQDVPKEFIVERNRILQHIPSDQRIKMRRKLNKIAISYKFKVSNWSRKQKVFIDMV